MPNAQLQAGQVKRDAVIEGSNIVRLGEGEALDPEDRRTDGHSEPGPGICEGRAVGRMDEGGNVASLTYRQDREGVIEVAMGQHDRNGVKPVVANDFVQLASNSVARIDDDALLPGTSCHYEAIRPSDLRGKALNQHHHSLLRRLTASAFHMVRRRFVDFGTVATFSGRRVSRRPTGGPPVPTSKQRREAARRHLERQLERRQQRDARRRQITLLTTVIGTLVVFAIVITTIVMLTHDTKKTNAAASPSSSASASTSPTSTAKPGVCAYVAGGTAAKKVSLPAAKAPITGTVTASVKTTQGDLTFALDRAKAPCTVASFESLIKQKYYDNTPCHRLTTSGIFVLQCGDPTGTGTGGPGYTIPDEFKGSEKYTPGVLAMANTGQANSGGGQFFIVYKNTPLPAQYTVFGTVTKGLDVVNKVAKAGSNNKNSAGDGAPKLPIKIISITVAG